MKVSKISITILPLIIIALASAAMGQVKLTWKVMNYDITVDLPSNYTLDRGADVTCVLELKNQIGRPYDGVTLRISENAVVESVSANGTRVDFSTGKEKLSDRENLQRLKIRVNSVPADATVRLAVKYKMKVAENSGLAALSPVGSHFIPNSFWYPTPTSWYYTGGADFAPVNIKVSNLGDRTLVGPGTMNAGGIANSLLGQPVFLVGKWKAIEDSGVTVYAPESKIDTSAIAKEMAGLAREAKEFYEGLLGIQTNTPLKIVAVNRGAGFSDSGLLFVERGAFFRGRLDGKTAVGITESVAKMYLGNVIETGGNGFGVIREGLSRHLSNKFIEERIGSDVAKVLRNRQISNYAAISDKDSPLNIVSPVDGYFYSSTGNKGAMIWNYLENSYGANFYILLKAAVKDREITLGEVRSSFNGQKAFLDYSLEQVTGLNLMAGLPRQSGNSYSVALRNLGDLDVTVAVEATDQSGKKQRQSQKIPAKGFGEAVFQSQSKIVSAEIDPDKLYPQMRYVDDLAPRLVGDDDPLVFIKREFDGQEAKRLDKAIANARIVLARYPAFEDARVFLARSLLAQKKLTDARTEFEKVLNARIPSPQAIAWSMVGLGDIARLSGDNPRAIASYNAAIAADAEYGSTLTARRGRMEIGGAGTVSSEVRDFFDRFDKAVIANSKNAVEGLLLEGEIARFSANVAGQAQAWSTEILNVDELDPDNIIVETNLTLKLLNRSEESGLAVFKLSRVNGALKMSGVEVFEVS